MRDENKTVHIKFSLLIQEVTILPSLTSLLHTKIPNISYTFWKHVVVFWEGARGIARRQSGPHLEIGSEGRGKERAKSKSHLSSKMRPGLDNEDRNGGKKLHYFRK